MIYLSLKVQCQVIVFFREVNSTATLSKKYYNYTLLAFIIYNLYPSFAFKILKSV